MVRLVDQVAYINHDIDDAVRAGILAEADLPAAEIELLGPTGAERIDTLVRDIVATSREGDVAQSDEVGGAMLRLRKFMFERVYLGPERAASTIGCSGRCAACSTTISTTGSGRRRRRGGRRPAAGHRLHRRYDGPVRDRLVPAPRASEESRL